MFLNHLKEKYPELQNVYEALCDCSKLSEQVIAGGDKPDLDLERQELSCYAPIFAPVKYEAAATCLSKNQDLSLCKKELQELENAHSSFGTRLMKANSLEPGAPCASVLQHMRQLLLQQTTTAPDDQVNKARFQAEICVSSVVCPVELDNLRRLAAQQPDGGQQSPALQTAAKHYDQCLFLHEMSFLATQGQLHKQQ